MDRRPPASIRTCAASRPDSIAGRIPSPLSGYASPAASPIVSAPGATIGRLPAPEARYAWPRHRTGPPALTVPRRSSQRDELADVAVEVAAIAAADADVEVVALGDTPPVPFEIAAEDTAPAPRSPATPCSPTRNSASLATTGVVVSAPPRRCRATGQKCPPAPMTIGASIASLAIQVEPRPPQAFDRRLLEHPRAGTAQKKGIELASANRVADNAWIPRLEQRGAEHAGTEGGDLLQGQARVAVVGRSEFEQSRTPRA